MSATRRLVAIFYADVAGYSRLTGADEEGTHRRVMAVLDDVTARIGAAGGTVLRYAGDAILATFPSVVLAVDSSAAIQTALAEREAGVAEDERVRIRIGINLGDVIEDRGEVYGEGVNLAARLEAAAEPGGLCISAAAHDQCRRKVALAFRDGGEQQFKNIDGAVRVWHWPPGEGGNAAAPRDEALPLPDRPSIAVLPFTNMSGDPEQEYFSDGITEDIITELSRFRSLFVIARNSTFTFKGQGVDVKDVGRKLGVAYVVEGSVRKVGSRVRVTAQLIHTPTGNHVWAERYDRELSDFFVLQDEMTRTIVSAILPELEEAERERARRMPPGRLDAWANYHRGMWHIFSSPVTLEKLDDANASFHQALARDASFSPAHAGLAYSSFQRVLFDLYGNDAAVRARLLDEAHDQAGAAIRLDDRDAFAHYVFGRVLSVRGDFDAAFDRLNLAIELNPNLALAHYGLGFAFVVGGRPAEAIGVLDTALRLSPRDPYRWAFSAMASHALILLGDYEGALVRARRAMRDGPEVHWPLVNIISALAHLGRIDEAKGALHQLLRLRPDFSLATVGESLQYKTPSDREHYLAGLRMAGVAG